MIKFLRIFVFVPFVFCACKSGSSGTSQASATPPSSTPEPELHLIDASTSKVGASPIAVSLKSFGVKVPTFTIDYSNNTYVQILRCGASYHAFLESEVTQAANATNTADRQWPWRDAFGNNTYCKVVTLKSNAKEYADLAAPDGNFFYVINPCVSADLSTTQKDDCSYNLTFTEDFKFNGALSDQFTLQAALLDEAESQYDGTILKFLGLVQKLQDYQNSCLVNFQNDQAKKDAQQFWGDIGTVAGGVVVTGILGFLTARALKGRGWEEAGGVKSAIAQHPYLAAATVAGAAAGITTLIRRLTASGAQLGPYCAKADAVAAQIKDMKDKDDIGVAKDKLIAVSAKMSSVDARFTGYDNCIMTADPGACAAKK